MTLKDDPNLCLELQLWFAQLLNTSIVTGCSSNKETYNAESLAQFFLSPEYDPDKVIYINFFDGDDMLSISRKGRKPNRCIYKNGLCSRSTFNYIPGKGESIAEILNLLMMLGKDNVCTKNFLKIILHSLTAYHAAKLDDGPFRNSNYKFEEPIYVSYLFPDGSILNLSQHDIDKSLEITYSSDMDSIQLFNEFTFDEEEN